MKAIDILVESAQKFSNLPVIIDEDGTLTYEELNRQIALCSSKLKEAGLKAGMHAAICIKDSREFILYLFAASACGATVVPLGYYLERGEFKELIRDLAIDCLIHYKDFDCSDLLGQSSSGIDEKFNLTFFENCAQAAKINFKNAAFIRPTSGTTGRAKGVVFSHETILARVDNALLGLKIGPEDRILWVLPMAYHFIVSIILYVRAGAAVIIPKDKKSSNLIEMANKHGATVLYAGPMDFIELTDENSQTSLPKLKLCICTVGGVSPALAEKFQRRHSNILRQVYGMIEVGLPLGNVLSETAPIDSVGKLMSGFDVRLVDDAGKEVPAGTVGALQVRGQGLFDGYFNPFIPREAVSKESWFPTGDLASCDENGNFYIAGRHKSMFLVSGMRVFSEEVESVLNDHPAVKISRVSLSNKLTGSIRAELEIHSGVNVSTPRILTYCKERLAPYKVPQEIVITEKIPLTATGKVLRHEV